MKILKSLLLKVRKKKSRFSRERIGFNEETQTCFLIDNPHQQCNISELGKLLVEVNKLGLRNHEVNKNS